MTRVAKSRSNPWLLAVVVAFAVLLLLLRLFVFVHGHGHGRRWIRGARSDAHVSMATLRPTPDKPFLGEIPVSAE
jgi:hypothetical protein